MAIKYTEEQLNSVNKSMLIQMFLNQQEQLEKVSADLHSLDTKMQVMMEQLPDAIARRYRFIPAKVDFETEKSKFVEWFVFQNNIPV